MSRRPNSYIFLEDIVLSGDRKAFERFSTVASPIQLESNICINIQQSSCFKEKNLKKLILESIKN